MEKGIMTGDLAILADPPAQTICGTEEFIDEIGNMLETIWK